MTSRTYVKDTNHGLAPEWVLCSRPWRCTDCGCRLYSSRIRLFAMCTNVLSAYARSAASCMDSEKLRVQAL